MMSLRLSFVLVLLVAPWLRGAERDIVRRFPVKPGCCLNLDTYRGSITITESDVPEVRVAVHFEIGADSELEADRMMAAMALRTTAEGARISVELRDPAQDGPRFVWNDKKQIEPTFRITVPTACDLELRTIHGAITVGNITGHLRARTQTGDIFFRRVGGDVSAVAEAGNVVVSRCLGALTTQVGQGAIHVGTVTGPCVLRTGNGDIDVMAAKSDLQACAEAGNASINLPGDFSGTADVTTNGGTIFAHIDPAANCRVDASASFLANVRTKLPLHIESGRDGSRRLVGTLNRGEHRVTLRAHGGGVRLLPGDSPFDLSQQG